MNKTKENYIILECESGQPCSIEKCDTFDQALDKIRNFLKENSVYTADENCEEIEVGQDNFEKYFDWMDEEHTIYGLIDNIGVIDYQQIYILKV